MNVLPRWRRSGPERRAALFVLGCLFASVVLIYVLIVVGGGVLIGQTDSPNVWLSVLATAIVALAFGPLQQRFERLAARVVLHDRPSPYDVLSRFSQTVAVSQTGGDLPVRMARMLAEGTGSDWAQVWLIVNDRPALAATWPDRAGADTAPPREDEPTGRKTLPVKLGAETLGMLRIKESARQPLTPVEERLFSGLAGQAGLVLRGVALRAELGERAGELAQRAGDLRRSRQRLVDTQDGERRRLERDIHDGAQQHLVALAVNLRLAQTLANKSPDRARDLMREQVHAADSAIETLGDLSRGIYPQLLTASGVAAALCAAVRTSNPPVNVVDDVGSRVAADVEAAVYFCCLEAIQNAAKHSGAHQIDVSLGEDAGQLTFAITDDGDGFDPAAALTGEGLANMRDRIDAVGGGLSIESDPSRGTRVVGWVPSVAVA